MRGRRRFRLSLRTTATALPCGGQYERSNDIVGLVAGDGDDYEEAARLLREDADPDEVLSFFSDETVKNDAKRYLFMRWSSAAPASVGRCVRCDSDLQFEGHADGLRVCCVGNPKHCWSMAGDPFP